MKPLHSRQVAWLARYSGRGRLSPFSRRDLEQLDASVGATVFPAGAPLMTQSKPVEFVGVIHEGQVELYRRSGLRRVVLQVLHDGDVFGDIPFLCDMSAPVSARALTESRITALDPDTFISMLNEHPYLCHRFMFSLASRLERMQRRLLGLTSGDLRHQVVTLLLDETGGQPGAVPLTQSTIAELLGASRPAVNRVLKALEEEGCIKLGYGMVEVIGGVQLKTQPTTGTRSMAARTRSIG